MINIYDVRKDEETPQEASVLEERVSRLEKMGILQTSRLMKYFTGEIVIGDNNYSKE